MVFPPPLVPLDEYEVTLTPAVPVTLPAGVVWFEVYNDAGGGDAWYWLTGTLDPQNGIAASSIAFTAPGANWSVLNPDMAMVVCGGVISAGTQYCPGDGVVPHTVCPCGNNNNGALGGCDWGDPAFPEGGVLDAIGTDSMAASDTNLVATGISDNFGVFFGAANQVNGGNGNPLNDGLRCAGGGLVRLTPPAMASGNQATTPQPIQVLDTGAAAGVTRRYQYWFRTPGGPCGQTANLTNGYEIVWVL